MRKLFVLLILLVLVGLQNSLFVYLKVFGVVPDLLLTFAICISLIKGHPWGTIIGITGGILEDIFFVNGFGINSIACMITAFIISSAEGKIYKDNIFIPAIFTFAGTIVKELIVFLFLYLTRANYQFMYALNNIILREAVYNTILAAIFFRYVVKLGNRFLSEQNWRF